MFQDRDTVGTASDSDTQAKMVRKRFRGAVLIAVAPYDKGYGRWSGLSIGG